MASHSRYREEPEAFRSWQTIDATIGAALDANRAPVPPATVKKIRKLLSVSSVLYNDASEGRVLLQASRDAPSVLRRVVKWISRFLHRNGFGPVDPAALTRCLGAKSRSIVGTIDLRYTRRRRSGEAAA